MIRATSISYLARTACDDALAEIDTRTYVKALLLLNMALQYKEEGLYSDPLSAVILLSFFEVFNCIEAKSWIRHAGGAGRLIHLRGPERHRSGFGRLVFLASRCSIILESYINRSRRFLDTQLWHQLDQELRGDLYSTNPVSVYTTDFC